MLSGILSGVVWGSVVGGLVLVLAALVLDLDRDPGGAEAEAGGGTTVAVDAIADGPVLLQRLHALMPPEPVATIPRAVPAPRRTLLPRPGQPVLPRLVAGVSVPVLHADIPPAPPTPKAVARVMPPEIPGLPVSVSVGAPRRVPPLSAPTGGPAPAGPSPVALPQVLPPPPAAPEPLSAAPSPPRVGPPPGTVPAPVILPGRAGGVPVRGAAARLDEASAPGGPPGRPAPPVPGPQVAFVLDGTTAVPVPDWLHAHAVPDGGAAWRLDDGAMVFTAGNGVSEYLMARATGAPALLVYARLDTVDDVALDRIALRARRDGAVAVLVAPDVALWDRIGAWLDGRARDLVPVAAGTLVD